MVKPTPGTYFLLVIIPWLPCYNYFISYLIGWIHTRRMVLASQPNLSNLKSVARYTFRSEKEMACLFSSACANTRTSCQGPDSNVTTATPTTTTPTTTTPTADLPTTDPPTTDLPTTDLPTTTYIVGVYVLCLLFA